MIKSAAILAICRHRLTHGRQLRPNHAGNGRIVEAGHRQLARQIEPEFARHRDHRRGHVVVAGEYGGRRSRRTQHPFGADQAVAEHEVAGLDQVGVDRNLVRAHFVDETEIALFGGAMLGSSQNEADAAVSEAHQMRRDLPCRGVVVDSDRRGGAQIVFRRDSNDGIDAS